MLIDARGQVVPDPWGDPLGGNAVSALDRQFRTEAFQRELGEVLGAINRASTMLDGLDRRKLADPRMAGFVTPLGAQVGALAASAESVLGVLGRGPATTAITTN